MNTNVINAPDSPLFLCTWNGDEIIEEHTTESLKSQYDGTNLFDNDECWYIAPHTSITFDKLFEKMEVDDEFVQKETTFVCDNMTIKRI